MAHKDTSHGADTGADIKDKNFVVWRVMEGKRRLQEKRVKKMYNERSRQRHETRH